MHSYSTAREAEKHQVELQHIFEPLVRIQLHDHVHKRHRASGGAKSGHLHGNVEQSSHTLNRFMLRAAVRLCHSRSTYDHSHPQQVLHVFVVDVFAAAIGRAHLGVLHATLQRDLGRESTRQQCPNTCRYKRRERVE